MRLHERSGRFVILNGVKNPVCFVARRACESPDGFFAALRRTGERRCLRGAAQGWFVPTRVCCPRGTLLIHGPSALRLARTRRRDGRLGEASLPALLRNRPVCHSERSEESSVRFVARPACESPDGFFAALRRTGEGRCSRGAPQVGLRRADAGVLPAGNVASSRPFGPSVRADASERRTPRRGVPTGAAEEPAGLSF